MKQNHWLILTILILGGIVLLLAALLEQQESKPESPYPGLIPIENEPAQQPMAPEAQPAPGEVVAVEERILEPAFPVLLAYDKYLTSYTYLFVDGVSVNIRSGPSITEPVIGKAFYGQRLNYLESVMIAREDGGRDTWFHVVWEEEGESRFGFIHSSTVRERLYQFDKMEEAIEKAEDYAEMGGLTYISNYQNQKGYAPLYQGGTLDAKGNRRSQSAPAYISAEDLENFVYLGDGTLVRYLFSDGEYARIQEVNSGERYYVPLKYIPKDHKIHELTKAIVIDVTNQNEGVFEKIQGVWTLISYTQATTGTTGRYSQPTPTGFYFAMESRPYFRYYEDGTTKIQGYAPYAIRFAGGAYVHGVPVNYRVDADGTLIIPPAQEYSKTIGTVPLSHKCVRNYTSHAKFLYNWFTPGETIVIVID